MKNLFLLLLCYVHLPLQRDEPTFIDPTGTYVLRGDVKKNNITGHYGEIRVRLLDKRTAAFCLYINNGYPSFLSGAFLDTVGYEDNRFLFRPAKDSACALILTFSMRDVDIMEVLYDPRSECGLAPGVMEAATFRKVSSEVPVIQDLSARGQPGG
jgi:hypothetical protein